MIANLYRELGYPAITSTLSKDGVTKATVVKGYKCNVSLTDKLYVNNDSGTMEDTSGANVLIFDHKITSRTYDKILKPLSNESKMRGKHLVVIAPYYDEMALSGSIQNDLNKEYKQFKDINLVLTVCRNSGVDKTNLNDLAMLMNTSVITSPIEKMLCDALEAGDPTYKHFNLDNRSIPNIQIATTTPGSNNLTLDTYKDGMDNVFQKDWVCDVRVGYCDFISIGLKESTFSGFYYDKDIYKVYMDEAKKEYEDAHKKAENVGASYSFDLANKQQRLHSLGLKTGVIEVGSDTELSQTYKRDMVDDAIKAAASAYNNGIILGCNVTLLKVIENLIKRERMNENESDIDEIILNMIYDGFRNVYVTILDNVFHNGIFRGNSDNVNDWMRENTKYGDIFHTRVGFMNCTIHDAIIDYSIREGVVFDLGTGEFNDMVINSAETDKEILKATMDLLKLLIVGNQLILR